VGYYNVLEQFDCIIFCFNAERKIKTLMSLTSRRARNLSKSTRLRPLYKTWRCTIVLILLGRIIIMTSRITTTITSLTAAATTATTTGWADSKRFDENYCMA